MKCVISCEHASNRVPARFAPLFRGKEKILSTHQAYDPGAAVLARRLARQLHTSVHLGTTSRLLIDLNRSLTNRRSLFSAYSRIMPPDDRELLLEKYYTPYRENVEREIGRFAAKGKSVLHVSVHSFSPVKGGRVRKADIGLLYDPARRNEKLICGYLAALFKDDMVSLRVRRNYPYQGKTDGFTSFMRRKYPPKLYAGIEIEINQALLSLQNKKRKKVEKLLAEGIGSILQQQDFARLGKIYKR